MTTPGKHGQPPARVAGKERTDGRDGDWTTLYIPNRPSQLVLRKEEGPPLPRGQRTRKEQRGLCFSLVASPRPGIPQGLGAAMLRGMKEKGGIIILPREERRGQRCSAGLWISPSPHPLTVSGDTGRYYQYSLPKATGASHHALALSPPCVPSLDSVSYIRLCENRLPPLHTPTPHLITVAFVIAQLLSL